MLGYFFPNHCLELVSKEKNPAELQSERVLFESSTVESGSQPRRRLVHFFSEIKVYILFHL